MVAIFSCQVHGTLGESYWAYIPDPIVHPETWSDTRIKISTNNVTLLGGSDSSHILHQWAFLNYSAQSHSPPLCLSRRDGVSCLNVQLTSQMSSAVGSLDNSASQKHLYTIVKVGFPGWYPIDQWGHPGTLPHCPNFEEKFFGVIPPRLDCAYPIPVIHGFGTNSYLWDCSHRHTTSSKEGDKVTPTGWILPILVTYLAVMQQDIWWLAAAMGPVKVLSSHNSEEVCHNITACISPPYLLLMGDVNIVKCTAGREPYYEIHCEHCVLTHSIKNSQPLDLWRILIVKQSAFVMLSLHVNDTWYDNPRM
jgi:hypothetical protein